MIGLTRTSGEHCCLDPAQIQRIENCPDTVVFLTDGAKYPVLENIDQIVGRIREYRAAVVSSAYQFVWGSADADDRPTRGAALVPVRDGQEG